MSSYYQYSLESEKTPNFTSRPENIDHLSQLSENLGALLLNEEYADVTLIVEEQNLHAHKVILAARSEYFRALFYGGMKESQQSEIVLRDAPLKAFKVLLNYIYTGHMSWRVLSEEIILETLGLANQYGFQDLEKSISDILRQMLAVKNVCAILEAARFYDLDQLVKVCLTFIDQHAMEILTHKSLLNLSQASLVEILQRDSFLAAEVDIFIGMCSWCKNNVNKDRDGKVMKCVRLPLMTVTELLSVVRPAELVNPDVLLDAIAERKNAKMNDLPHRGQLLIDQNVASFKYGSKVIAGENMDELLSGDSNYDLERGFTRHAIGDKYDPGIIVQLGKPSIINHIHMLLWDKDHRSYSYYIEVSMDMKDWTRVIDYSNYFCRSWQNLYFKPRVVLYIKIFGTYNTVNKLFHLVTLEAFYRENMPKLVGDIICPDHNVATVDKSATVMEGVSRTRNALLDGDFKHYNLDNGYTCHQLGSGCILVQLGQPYIISSMRLLLWDCDDRSYSYYIYTSVTFSNFEMLIDRSRENWKSWQTLQFPPKPIVFIQILGQRNTVNEVFHCVHFECPASTELEQPNETPKSKESGSQWEERGAGDATSEPTVTEGEEIPFT